MVLLNNKDIGKLNLNFSWRRDESPHEVAIPVATPVTTLPTMICGIVNAVHCRMVPRIQIHCDTIIVRRLPIFRPNCDAIIHPRKQPRLYTATMVPVMEEEGYPNCERKESALMMPAKTPLSYPNSRKAAPEAPLMATPRESPRSVRNLIVVSCEEIRDLV